MPENHEVAQITPAPGLRPRFHHLWWPGRPWGRARGHARRPVIPNRASAIRVDSRTFAAQFQPRSTQLQFRFMRQRSALRNAAEYCLAVLVLKSLQYAPLAV